MMKLQSGAVLVWCLICGTLATLIEAAPLGNGNHGNGNHGNSSAPTVTTPAVVRRMRPGIVPFPQGVDDLQIFPYQHYLLVTGSRFISIEPDNTCWDCHLSEDLNTCVQQNQTLCNQTITNGECPRSVAGLFCTEITDATRSGPIYVQLAPYKQMRPACYIRKDSMRFQPVYNSQIYFLQPKLESCNFAIANTLPAHLTQYPAAAKP